MKNTGLILAAAMIAVGACSKGNTADQPLQNDLSLAQQQNQARLDSISAAERYAGETGRQRSRHIEASSGAVRRSNSGGGEVAAPAPERTTLVRHTQRDAEVGAAAGAAIGALSSKNRLQGGIIGAAAGGLLGGILGNNVDVQKKKKP